MLINIKGGVSFLRINSRDEFLNAKRIGGSIMGESVFGGLVKLLSKCKTSTEAQLKALAGDFRNVDMLVEDIYGKEGLDVLGLPSNLLASSFGKA